MHNSLWVGGSIGRRGFPMLGTGKRGLSTYVKQLFANNEQGFFYDPNDLSTMYQNAAGTIPVTAAGQPVGLMLDKSKGLVLSSELVKNGDFSDGSTDWNLEATWVLSNNAIIATNAPSGTSTYQNLTTTLGRFYKITFTVSNYIAGSVFPTLFNGDNGAAVSSNGTFSSIVLKRNTGLSAIGLASFGFSGTIDNISVKEIAGNHAYQTVSASRPILRQTPVFSNELIQDGGFDNPTKWVLAKGWKVVDSRLVLDGTGNGAAYQAVQLNAVSDYLVEFDLVSRTGNVDFFLGSGATYALSTLGTGRKSFIMKRGVNNNCGFYASAVGAQVVVDNLSIKEITGYRTDQNYLSFDGIDDSLQTNNIDFTATDKVSLFAGVKHFGATTSMLVELSSNSSLAENVRAFYLTAPEDTTRFSFRARTKVDVGQLVSSPSLEVGSKNIIRAVADLSVPISVFSVNGKLSNINNSSALGTGNLGNHPLYIGRRGGTSLPFNGHIYSLIGVGRLTTDNETKAIEKELAKRTGVTLNV